MGTIKSNLSLHNRNISEAELHVIELNIIKNCTDSILAAKHFDGALQVTIDILCDQIGWDVGHAYAVDLYGKDEMVSTKLWHFNEPEKYLEFKHATEQILRFQPGVGLPGKVLNIGEPAWLNNIQNDQDSPRKKLCKDMAVKGAFAFPVKDNNRIIAVLEFFSKDELNINSSFLNSIQNIGKYLGVLLSKIHVEKYLQDQKTALDQSALVSQTDLDGRIVYINSAFRELFKYSEHELLGKDHAILSTNSMHPEETKALWNTIKSGNVWCGEFKNVAQNGAIYWISSTIVPLKEADGRPYQFLSISFNITDRKKMEEQISFLAYHDPITSLANNIYFKKCLSEALINYAEYLRNFVLVYIEFNELKVIHNMVGHEVADKLIREVNWRLQRYVRNIDIACNVNEPPYIEWVARVSSDEFLLILDKYRKDNNLQNELTNLKKMLEQPYRIDEEEYGLVCKIGVAAFPEDGDKVDILIKNAYSAICTIKSDDQGINFYDQEIDNQVSRKLSILNQLSKALENDELGLLYQPKFDMQTNNIIGVEALLRWYNPELGVLLPSYFIDILEQSSLILPIGEWVLRTAVNQTCKWRAEGFTDLQIAVNVSMRQFTMNLIDIVQRIIDKFKLPPELLDLELTERVIMHDMQQTIKILQGLKEIGVKVSIDDFGTGYSSLQYLSELPIDMMKIDGSFMINILQKPNNAIVSQAIIALGHSLNMTITAEGVETEDQLRFLKQYNCNYAQGFYFAKPLPPSAILYMLREQRKRNQEQ